MTSIGSALSNAYYQLNGQASGNGATNATPSLASILGNASDAVTPASAGSTDGYILNLSAQAQALLGGSSTASSSDPTGASSNFALSDAQQKQINAILAKYKDAPYTQDTFNQIQNDLKAAGLSPDQLKQEDQLKSFNATQVLISALSGVSAPITAPSDADETTKSNNYMSSIISQWQSVSTTAAVAGDDALSGSGGTSA